MFLLRLAYTLSLLTLSSTQSLAESKCFGSTKSGKLEQGVKLPTSGKNFSTYSDTLSLAGRTYVHSKVKSVLLSVYETLHKELPSKVFMYAETGWRSGGLFRPHKTHQNGLSVDHMVPVVDQKTGASVLLPTSALNKWGYSINFDKNGSFKRYRIDFETLARFIVEIDKESKKQGVKIWRVIFDPLLQSKLYASKYGKYLSKNILIPKKKSWVRHDEHIHIDFKINCRPLDELKK